MQKISVTVAVVLFVSLSMYAQNPVSDALQTRLTSVSKNTITAAETMPADKYGFKPTAQQAPFGHWASHASGANYLFCSKLTGDKAPEAGVKETDSKDKLVAALKKSFEYCAAQLPKLQDAQLADEVEVFGPKKWSKAAIALEISADWADHYAQMSTYLRLNGLLPPTAKK